MSEDFTFPLMNGAVETKATWFCGNKPPPRQDVEVLKFRVSTQSPNELRSEEAPNNRLTLAEGFSIPPGHAERFDILPVLVGTDTTSALKARRGTGYYKVPSLRGVWYRGPFEHNGSVATLQDQFDPRRLRDDYVPTGHIGYGLKTRAVKGHRFWLDLSAEDKKALIAFLKTL